MLELLKDLLPIVVPALISLIIGWLAPSPMYKKIKEAGKALFDAIEDDEVTAEEEKNIAAKFKALFKKEE